jgi:hypothetical protein
MGCTYGKVDDNLKLHDDENVKFDLLRKKISDSLKFYKIKDMSIVTKDEYICVKKPSWKKTIFYNYKVLTLKSKDLSNSKRTKIFKASLDKFLHKNRVTKYFSFPQHDNSEFAKLCNLTLDTINLENAKSIINGEALTIDVTQNKHTLVIFINYPEDVAHVIDNVKNITDTMGYYIVLRCNDYPVYAVKIDILNSTNDVSRFYYIDCCDDLLNFLFANKTCILLNDKEIMNYFTIDYLIAAKDFIDSSGYDIDFLLSEFKDNFLDDNDEFDKTAINTHFCLTNTYSAENVSIKSSVNPLLVIFSNKSINEDLTSYLSKVPGCYVVYKDDNVIKRLKYILREFDLKYEIRVEKHKVYSSLLHGFKKDYNIKVIVHMDDAINLDKCNNIIRKVSSFNKTISISFLPAKNKLFDVDKMNCLKNIDMDGEKDNLILFVHRNTDGISLSYIIENFDIIAKTFNRILVFIERSAKEIHSHEKEFVNWSIMAIDKLCPKEEIINNIYYQPDRLRPEDFHIIITDTQKVIKFSDTVSMSEFIDNTNMFTNNISISAQFYKSIKLEQRIIIRDVLSFDDTQILSTRRTKEKCYIKNSLKSYNNHCRFLSHKTISINYIKVYSDECYFRNYKLTIKLPKNNMDSSDFVNIIDLDKKTKLNLDLELYHVKSIIPNNYCEDCHIKLIAFYYFCPITQKSLCVHCESKKNQPDKHYPFSLFYINLQSKPELLYSILEANYENFKLTQEYMDRTRFICFLCDEYIINNEATCVWMNMLYIPLNEKSYLCTKCVQLISDVNRVENELNNKESRLFEKLLEHDIDINNMILKKIVCLNKN